MIRAKFQSALSPSRDFRLFLFNDDTNHGSISRYRLKSKSVVSANELNRVFMNL
jgi:hypothetical protein